VVGREERGGGREERGGGREDRGGERAVGGREIVYQFFCLFAFAFFFFFCFVLYFDSLVVRLSVLMNNK